MSLSRESEFRIQLALDSAWADSTHHKYRGVILSFLSFCDSELIPKNECCPASELLLCAFASSRMGSLSGLTVQSHLSALKAWHTYHNAPWNGATRLKLVLTGVSNRAPELSLHPSRPSVTCSMLLVLASKLSLSDPFDSCCMAAATAAFWGQLCLGEILSPWESSFPTAHTACRVHLSSSFNQNGSHKLFLPFTKVKESKGEEVILCRQSDTSDSIVAVEHHLQLNEASNDLPLFSYTLPTGFHCLTHRKFLTRCNSIWSLAGFTPTSGHSFHIGRTTELLLAGVPPDIVKALG
ncbi:hypothetical protein EV702DRAFT_973859 [Suillus placidus]|uniref:Uncharacterized protein n=1 Tax=Suillus placidus TaxID=48579 RepID=A0A9P7D1E3_9AGAM|nr:hypothetical protein EV702DRAFT_973859 [Suillus placidus]